MVINNQIKRIESQFRLRDLIHAAGILQFEPYGFREIERTSSLADEAGSEPHYNCLRCFIAHFFGWTPARLLGICRLPDQRRGDFNLPEKYCAALVNHINHGLHR